MTHESGTEIEPSITESRLAALAQAEVLDQFRMFKNFEHYLLFPKYLSPQLVSWYQIPPHIKTSLIEKYYSYDDAVMREVVNKKLAKSRKDLEEISESTSCPVLRVTRQSENLKRIYTYLEEDRQFRGNIIRLVENVFLLPVSLCRR